MHKTCTGIKKAKVWASTQGWGSIDCKILVILVFLMPVQVLWRSCFGFFVFFDACAGFVTLTFTKPAQASKKNKKKQTTRCTKPAQASTKETKVWASTQGWGSIDCKILVILFFLMPVQVLWRSCFGFFSFCWCLCMFCQKVCRD